MEAFYAGVAMTKYHRLDGLKQKCILLQFWGPEIQDQYVCRAVSPTEPPGQDPSASFWEAQTRLGLC